MIYIYVKIHKVTGLKYFGKTTKDNYAGYLGSGLIWKRHLSKYGNHVVTFLIKTFENNDMENCKNFCIKFSEDNNIVKSKNWANLRVENGMDGAPVGHEGSKPSEESRRLSSERSKEMWQSLEFRDKISISQKQSWDSERKIKHAEKLSGRKRPDQSERLKGSRLPESHPFNKKEVPKKENHKEKISKALKNRPKSLEHKMKLAWNKFKNKQDFENYLQFIEKCSKLKLEGNSISKIADTLKVSWDAVKTAIMLNNEYLLAEK